MANRGDSWGPDDPIELYDLTVEVAEAADIAAREPETAAALVQAAIAVLRDEGATPELVAPRAETTLIR